MLEAHRRDHRVGDAVCGHESNWPIVPALEAGFRGPEPPYPLPMTRKLFIPL